MRKWLYRVALAAFIVFPCSCIREKNFESYAPEPEAISFVISGYATRSESLDQADALSGDGLRVNRYSLGTDDQGNMFTLEETVTLMGDWDDAPATRGTPAYTENVQDVHGSAFRGFLYNPTSGEKVDEGDFEAMEDGVRWRRQFGFDPWAQSDPLDFFLCMPTAPTGLTNVAYNKNSGTFSFDYETPATAEAQQDILFARRSLTAAEYETEQGTNGGASILFRHALTGIKFNLGNNNTDAETGTQPEGQVETFITRVEFIGLKGKGSAVFSPDERNETNTDDIGQYSSKTSFTWTYDTSAQPMTFSQEYTDADIQDFTLTSDTDPDTGETQTVETGSVHGPASFYAAGNLRNLNTENASLTFWFIPQAMTADVKLRVTFYVWNGVSQGEEITKELNLGSRILTQSAERQTNWEWKAGELRTFKLTPTAVDVGIEEFEEPDPETPLVIAQPDIRNTGNKDAWIRVALVGNWVDSNTGEIVTRYWNSAATTPAWVAITPWTESQGTFSPALTTGSGVWRKNGDYWYYNAIVPAGKRPGEAADGTGTYAPLFNTYTKPASPTEGVDLMFDVAVQAIDAAAGNSYSAAWTAVGAYN